MKLGRRISALGQAGKVQGHLKIFTHKSLAEILELHGFEIRAKYGTTFFFPKPISFLDAFVSRWPSLASGLIFVAENQPESVKKGEPVLSLAHPQTSSVA